MAPPIPTREPTEVIAGDTWRWDRSFPDFSATDGYALSYRLRGEEDLDIEDGMVTASGAGWQIRVPTASTDILPGNYRLVGFVTLDGERDTVYEGTLVVVQNPAYEVGRLSHDERVLALIDAVIEGRATTDREEEAIAQRRYRLMPFADLLKVQGIYRRRVLQARDPDGEPRSVEVGFSAPC